MISTLSFWKTPTQLYVVPRSMPMAALSLVIAARACLRSQLPIVLVHWSLSRSGLPPRRERLLESSRASRAQNGCCPHRRGRQPTGTWRVECEVTRKPEVTHFPWPGLWPMVRRVAVAGATRALRC
eukprot:5556641-Prymnesium_polylepis.1